MNEYGTIYENITEAFAILNFWNLQNFYFFYKLRSCILQVAF